REGVTKGHADNLPGPLQRPAPEEDGGDHSLRPSQGPEDGIPTRDPGRSLVHYQERRPDGRAPLQISPRAQRGPAAARGHRPRTDPQPALPRARRADLVPRRLGPGAHPQPAQEPPEGEEPYISADLPPHVGR